MSCCPGNLRDRASDTSFDPLTGLCVVCQEIDVVHCTALGCPERRAVDGNAREIGRYHIGTVKDILKKDFCPSCRLIFAQIEPRLHEGLDSGTQVHLDRKELDALIPADKCLHSASRESGDEFGRVRSHGGRALDVVLETPYDNRFNIGTVVGTICRVMSSSCTTSHRARDQYSAGCYSVLGRPLSPNVDMVLIKEWVSLCDGHHGRRCTSHKASLDPQQIRLIDVDNYKIVNGAINDTYIALSYVWGKGATQLLTQETLVSFSQDSGLLESQAIPQTISDAIELARVLRRRYLWVDSLCIMDDTADKSRQLPLMGSIYACADLVIVAACGHDAHAGLPGFRRANRHIFQRVEDVCGITCTSTLPALHQALRQTTWNTRGWTFQEAMLARRILTFTDHQVYWSCQANSWREDLTGESPSGGLILNDDNSIWKHLDTPGQCRTKLYCLIAEEFSTRKFGNEGDVLWAFAGVLEWMTKRFPKGFVWAMPHERMDAALLWQEDTECPNVHYREAKHVIRSGNVVHTLRYPSWSWLSASTSVTFMDKCGMSLISEVIWMNMLKLGDTAFEASALLPNQDPASIGEKTAITTSTSAKPKSGVADVGYLRFDAQLAKFTLTREEYNEDTATWDKKFRAPLTTAIIQSRDVQAIGVIEVPVSYFGRGRTRIGEFLLLSSVAVNVSDEICEPLGDDIDCGMIRHIKGCHHILGYNLMLIERTGFICRRLGLCQIRKEEWAKIRTSWRSIILG